MLTAHTYRGREEEPIRIRGVFVQSGELNIELVQLVSTTPSAFHDMFPTGKKVSTTSPSSPMTTRANATPSSPPATPSPASSLRFGEQICYIDARDPLGHMIELYPPHKTIRAMYQKTRDAAAAWDGRELIIPWDLTGYEVE